MVLFERLNPSGKYIFQYNHVPFVIVNSVSVKSVTRYAVYMRFKYATTRAIAERPIHLSSCNGWADFWSEIKNCFVVFVLL